MHAGSAVCFWRNDVQNVFSWQSVSTTESDVTFLAGPKYSEFLLHFRPSMHKNGAVKSAHTREGWVCRVHNSEDTGQTVPVLQDRVNLHVDFKGPYILIDKTDHVVQSR